MLKRDITYEDYNGETVTETFYFNLTSTEVLDLQFGYEGGLDVFIKKIIAAEDVKSLISEFKKIILTAYGIKSEDGKRFIKNDTVREEFSQTAAYDALFMELSTNDISAANFIKGIIPSSIQKELQKAENAPELPYPPPPPAS